MTDEEDRLLQSVDGPEVQRIILRYNVPVDDCFHDFGLSGAVLHVDCRDPEYVEFWALDSLGPAVVRAFIVVGTGHVWPPDTKYVGTALTPSGGLVWHLLEAL